MWKQRKILAEEGDDDVLMMMETTMKSYEVN